MTTEVWTPLKLVAWTQEYFRKKGIEEPRLEAELLLAHVLGWKRIDLYARFEHVMTGEDLARYRELVKKRGEHVPVQYITGTCGFYGLEFVVDPRVLIPRPETEHVVMETLAAVKDLDRPVVVDLCTGSGVVAVTVAKNVPSAKVFAGDVSEEALEVAHVNAERHGVADRVQLFHGDLFEGLPGDLAGNVDVVTANPPYVSEDEFAGLMPEVRLNEPRGALVAGPTGLEVIERILREVPSWLKTDGVAILEIGFGQADRVAGMAQTSGQFEGARRVRDYGKVERVIVLKRRHSGTG